MFDPVCSGDDPGLSPLAGECIAKQPPERYRKRWLPATECGMVAFAAFVFMCVVICGVLVAAG